jgi:hypothetical protein
VSEERVSSVFRDEELVKQESGLKQAASKRAYAASTQKMEVMFFRNVCF